MGYRSYKNPLNKAPLRTVTGRGNDPIHQLIFVALAGQCCRSGFKASLARVIDGSCEEILEDPIYDYIGFVLMNSHSEPQIPESQVSFGDSVSLPTETRRVQNKLAAVSMRGW